MSRPRLLTVAVLALALAARLALIVPAARRPLDDIDNYLPLARSIAAGQGLAFKGQLTAYRPPLYPLILAPLVRLLGPEPAAGVYLLHLAAGLGTVALTVSTARRWGLGDARAWVAGAIVAADPVLVNESRSVMTETLAAFLIALSIRWVSEPGRRGAILGGLALGLAALCRPSCLAVAGLILAARFLLEPASIGGRIGRAGLLVGMIAAVLLPWAIRNARLYGEPVWTTTHGGYTLALANNPVYYDEVVNGPPGAVWTGANQNRWWHGNNLATDKFNEPQADRFLRNRALATMRQRPRDALRASLARLGRFWGLAPSGAVYGRGLRLAVAAWTAPFWLAVLLGLSRRASWSWPRVAAPAAVLGLTLVHTLYWTDLRMRAPIVPALALIAASAPLRRTEPDAPTDRCPRR